MRTGTIETIIGSALAGAGALLGTGLLVARASTTPMQPMTSPAQELSPEMLGFAVSLGSMYAGYCIIMAGHSRRRAEFYEKFVVDEQARRERLEASFAATQVYLSSPSDNGR